MRYSHVYVNDAKQYLILSNLFLPTFQHLIGIFIKAPTQLSNRLHYWDLNCLRLETESTIGFEALVKTSQFAKHLSVLYTIPSREGGTKD